ncbi:hypothetical protein OBBRIDRAFT_649217 [Obba rivulosa]|uniref:Uncharacterized protein n=1 Tax=Obba rivulosa TaxID=1052685 RepID=A0A8E2DLE6_9APHY|nr:hypothetical protein OBBRIDRAFT_649217 [Obba rivulosa]
MVWHGVCRLRWRVRARFPSGSPRASGTGSAPACQASSPRHFFPSSRYHLFPSSSSPSTTASAFHRRSIYPRRHRASRPIALLRPHHRHATLYRPAASPFLLSDCVNQDPRLLLLRCRQSATSLNHCQSVSVRLLNHTGLHTCICCLASSDYISRTSFALTTIPAASFHRASTSVPGLLSRSSVFRNPSLVTIVY